MLWLLCLEKCIIFTLICINDTDRSECGCWNWIWLRNSAKYADEKFVKNKRWLCKYCPAIPRGTIWTTTAMNLCCLILSYRLWIRRQIDGVFWSRSPSMLQPVQCRSVLWHMWCILYIWDIPVRTGLIKWKHFPRYYKPFGRGIPLTKASEAELWRFLWSAPE